jgi:Trk K+ transport system NAD-binding subunit
VPSGSDHIQAGDRLIVFTTQEAADQARDYFTSLKE